MDVGSKGKALGRRPQTAKFSCASKAQEGVNFWHSQKEGKPSPGVSPSLCYIFFKEGERAFPSRRGLPRFFFMLLLTRMGEK